MQKARGRGRGLVLVVDDEPAIQQVVADCLGDEGYRVASATTFAEAVDALTHTRFDLVLADVRGVSAAGPAIDRVALLEQLRDLAGYTPVVIVTARRESDVAPLVRRGFQGLLCKPFDLDALVAFVERQIAAARRD